MLQPLVRRTWAPRGQTPILYSWDRRDRLSAIAVLSVSPKRRHLGLYFDLQSDNIRTDAFELFVAEILQHLPRGIILVMDRWSVHRSGAKRLRKRFARRVDVEWLPAYAPISTQLNRSGIDANTQTWPTIFLRTLTHLEQAFFSRSTICIPSNHCSALSSNVQNSKYESFH